MLVPQLPPLLIDTNIISDAGKKKPPPGLRAWLMDIGIDRLMITFPVIAELRRGAHLKAASPTRFAEIMLWVDRVIAMDFPTLPMTLEVADTYARMTSTPALRHMWTVQQDSRRNRLGHDLMIAALSITYQAPIITGNAGDFEEIAKRFPLPGVFLALKQTWLIAPPFEVPLPEFKADPAADRTMLPTL
nr:type II toxin-antitoxin system VapC family toxin [Sinorhizobium meliloti]